MLTVVVAGWREGRYSSRDSILATYYNHIAAVCLHTRVPTTLPHIPSAFPPLTNAALVTVHSRASSSTYLHCCITTVYTFVEPYTDVK